MSAADQARKLKVETAVKEQEKEKQLRANRERLEAERQERIEWIGQSLGSFGMTVNKKHFGGHDYWTVSNGGPVLCSCVLRQDPTGYLARWVVHVYDGDWKGPADSRGWGVGHTQLEYVERAVAWVMKNHV